MTRRKHIYQLALVLLGVVINAQDVAEGECSSVEFMRAPHRFTPELILSQNFKSAWFEMSTNAREYLRICFYFAKTVPIKFNHLNSMRQ